MPAELSVTGPAIVMARWALTYFLHSTAIIATAAIIHRLLPAGALRVRDGLWKCALIGGLFTATAQTFGVISPIAVAIDFAPHDRSVQSPAVVETRAIAPDIPPVTQVSARLTPSADSLSRPADWFVAAWLVAATVSCTRRLLALRALRLRLARRRTLRLGSLRHALDQLQAAGEWSRPVRLSVSRRISVPLVVGSTEICVPPEVFRALDDEEQRALLAHELAHVVRRDPGWMAACMLIESVLVFQPLHRLARRHMRDASELLCDEWAAERVNDRLPLARCLVKVAEWDLQDPGISWATQFADQVAPLTARVQRLIDPPAGDALGVRSRLSLTVLPIALVGVLMPTIGTAKRGPAPVETAPAVIPLAILVPNSRISTTSTLSPPSVEASRPSHVAATPKRRSPRVDPDTALHYEIGSPQDSDVSLISRVRSPETSMPDVPGTETAPEVAPRPFPIRDSVVKLTALNTGKAAQPLARPDYSALTRASDFDRRGRIWFEIQRMTPSLYPGRPRDDRY